MATHRLPPASLPDLPAAREGPRDWQRRWVEGLVPRMMDRLQRALGEVPIRLELWNGAGHDLSTEPPRATVVVRSLGALLRLALDPARFFGDAYSAGEIEVRGSLTAGLEAVFERWPQSPAPPRRVPSAVKRLARRHA